MRSNWLQGTVCNDGEKKRICLNGSYLAGLLVASLLVVILQSASGHLVGPITTPISEPVAKTALSVNVVDWAQLPDTRNSIGEKPDRVNTTTRINFMRGASDGRFFVRDLRGQLHVLDRIQQPSIYVDLDQEGSSLYPQISLNTGLAAGFTTFEFLPEFEPNGLFYTIHSESAAGNASSPTWTVPDNVDGLPRACRCRRSTPTVSLLQGHSAWA